MKFCKDCKHFKRNSNIVDVCLSPNLPIDLVTSNPVFAICKDMRYPNKLTFNHFGIGHICGHDGDWFEPKIDEDADLDDLSTIPFGK